MYYGVIDIGSTTLRLSLYKYDNQQLTQIFNKRIFTKLNEDVTNNCLNADGMDAIIQGIKQYLEEMSVIPNVKVLCFAGAFIHELDNYETIAAEIYNRLLLHVDVLASKAEVKYAYSGFRKNKGFDLNKGLLVGVGGTSTLLIYFENDQVKHSASLALGSIKEIKNLFKGIIPNSVEAANIFRKINNELNQLSWWKDVQVDCLYSVGGNGRAVARIHKTMYKTKQNVEEYVVPTEDIEAIIANLIGMQDKAVLYLNEVVPGRINSFLPSALILDAIAKSTKAKEFKTARYGLREGYLLSHDLAGKE